MSLDTTTITAGDEGSQETPLTSPGSPRPAVWLCVSTASFTGRTPWMRRWDPPAAAAPLQSTLSPRMASCTTRQAPPTWARSSGSPASWCSGGHRGCGTGLGSDRALGRRCWEQFAAQELPGRGRGLILPPKGAKPPVWWLKPRFVGAQQQECDPAGVEGRAGGTVGPKAGDTRARLTPVPPSHLPKRQQWDPVPVPRSHGRHPSALHQHGVSGC